MRLLTESFTSCARRTRCCLESTERPVAGEWGSPMLAMISTMSFE